MTPPDDRTLLSDLIALAQRKGATAADALLVRSTSLSVTVRLGKTETLERSESGDIGLRVFKGRKQGIISTCDLRPDRLAQLVDRVLEIADASPEDSFAGLPEPDQLCTTQPALDLCDPQEPKAETLMERAGTCEAAALAVPGVTNSTGGSADWGRSDVTLVASNGFSGSYARSSHSLFAMVLAGAPGGPMERDYDHDSVVYGADLRDPVDIGRRAGERAARRVNPRTMPSQQVPVIFEARLARGLLSAFCGAINGATVARGATFLKDSCGQPVFNPLVTITEDPFLPGGLNSRPFDAEGLAPQRRALVDAGCLTGWLLDLRSARQLGLTSTGNASRGLSSPPNPGASNVWIANGTASVADLIADIKQGFFVTDLMGHGTDFVTGDYSRGASGFWIDNGRIGGPVNGLTVAGNLAAMFRATTPADDLDQRFGIDAPTLRIDGMTVAGSS